MSGHILSDSIAKKEIANREKGMSIEKSIFEYIRENLTESGMLPESFSLPSDEGEGKARFADGAMDGISIYHMGFSPLGDADNEELGKLVRLAADGKTKEAESGFEVFCRSNRAVKIIDALQGFIMDHREELSPGNMYAFATEMLFHSVHKECVKIGMCILELFNTYEDEEIANAIRTIGVSDEFTIFAVFLMRGWPDGNKEILELAKKVRGWGRIHCVDFIEPESDEIRKWLLFNGVDNDIVPAYSGYRVYEKADINGLLDEEGLSDQEIKAILSVISAMLDEGPVSGISNLDEPEKFLEKAIEKTESGYDLDETALSDLEQIKEWLRQNPA